MTLSNEEKKKLLDEIKADFLEEVKRRVVERLMKTYDSRLEHYYARVASELAPVAEAEFPL